MWGVGNSEMLIKSETVTQVIGRHDGRKKARTVSIVRQKDEF